MASDNFAGPAEPYYAPGWQEPQPDREPLAIAALICAVLVGPLGIGLGVAALVRTRRRGTRGRGQAMVAIAVGSGWTLVVTAFATAAVLTSLAARPLPSDVAAARDAQAIALVTGNCLDTLPPDGEVAAIRVVPCAEAHGAQVISQFAFPADSVWPGQAAADRRVALACELSEAETETGLVIRTWAPTEASWGRGDRTGLCLAHHVEGDPLTGTLITG